MEGGGRGRGGRDCKGEEVKVEGEEKGKKMYKQKEIKIENSIVVDVFANIYAFLPFLDVIVGAISLFAARRCHAAAEDFIVVIEEGRKRERGEKGETW